MGGGWPGAGGQGKRKTAEESWRKIGDWVGRRAERYGKTSGSKEKKPKLCRKEKDRVEKGEEMKEHPQVTQKSGKNGVKTRQ